MTKEAENRAPWNLFIDANIFLNFYDFHTEDLDQLKKLVDAINGQEIILYTTKQVVEEVKRNRDIRVSAAYKKFKDSKAYLEMPVICKTYPEYVKIKKLQGDIEEIKSELSTKLWKDIVKKSLRADEVINDLFDAATHIESDAFLHLATMRRQLGNPPGKKNDAHGDEINWEALLASVPSGQDLVLISEDSDFQSALSEDGLNSFLSEEWKSKKGAQIDYYQSLTGFFNQHSIEIHLRWEEEKNSLIESLTNSPNFSSSHEIIRRLSKFSSFSDKQIKGLATAALTNSQVSWIAEDPDVQPFYHKALEGKSELFDEETWRELGKLFFDQEPDKVPEKVASGIRIEDIPF